MLKNKGFISYFRNFGSESLGIYFSLILHFIILLFAIGLPNFFEPAPISLPNIIPIEIINVTDTTSIPKKIEDQKEKDRLKRLVKSITPKGFGVIGRTVAKGKKVAELDRDLQNLDDSLHEPLTLQIVNRTDAYNFLNIIYSLNETSFEIKTRPELPRALAIEWAFDKINSSKKGRQIKKFASRMGKSCPGSLCNHKKFEQLTSQNIAFGHIISQRWIRSFNFLLDKKYHPDNLYLTCQTCNSSLSDNFPDAELRNEIVTRGTIGDWLRESEKTIRNS